MSYEIALEEEFARTSLKRATLKRLLRYFAPHKGPILWALFLEVVWVVSMIVDPRLVQAVVDGPLSRRDFPGVMVLVGFMVANVVFRAALTAWELRITTRTGVKVLDSVRRDVFDHLQKLSMRYFDRNKQGRIIARADRDVDTLEHLVMWGPVVFVSLSFALVLGFTYLAVADARLTVWLVAAVPVLWGLSRVFSRLGMAAYRRVREAHAAISSHLAEAISGVRVVQAFCAEERQCEELERRQKVYRGAVMGGARVAGAYLPSLTLTFNAILLVVLVVGGRQVLAGALTLGELLAFVLLLGFVLGPVEGLGGLYNESLIAGAAAERIFLLLDTSPEVQDASGAIDPGRLSGALEFDSISFSYDPSGRSGRQLRDVSFRVAPNRTVALVGHTGAGKTSVLNLIARFYEAQEGAVLLDGHRIETLKLEALRHQVGVVLQENFLFAGTVLENLRFVKPGLTEEAAREGFSALGCREILERLPAGLETQVGERGASLSEGERQIVCFVRALLAEPAILLLDEATSAVDTRTEAFLLKALRRLAKRQTTVVIAHRLSTIRHADCIFVMEHGSLVEQGTHDELLARDGVYAGLYAEYAT